MAQITAELVKDLREKTGAGMMDCKKALTETDGDMESAIDWLRKKGLSAAAKKAGRVASEGLVGVMAEGSIGAIVEVNAETDFVARNDQFQNFVKGACALALKTQKDLDALKDHPYDTSAARTVSEELTHLIAVIGENMELRRLTTLEVKPGIVTGYVHGAITPGLGRIGVLVGLESTAPASALETLGKQLAMHIAAAAPVSLDVTDLDPTLVQRERDIFIDQAKASGKPLEIIENMVEGRIRKYYEQVVLLEQVFIMDNKSKISAVLKDFEKEHGTPVKLAGFVRFGLGEGIEKKESNFADEVASLSK